MRSPDSKHAGKDPVTRDRPVSAHWWVVIRQDGSLVPHLYENEAAAWMYRLERETVIRIRIMRAHKAGGRRPNGLPKRAWHKQPVEPAKPSTIHAEMMRRGRRLRARSKPTDFAAGDSHHSGSGATTSPGH